jgi:transcriptional regulator with XRE-family HTH domain
MDIEMKFSERLKSLRKEKGLSQEELAELLNVSRQSVSKWESGQTYPEIDKLIVLSDLFKITLDNFLKENDSKDTISNDDEMKVNDKEDIDEYLMIGGLIIGIAIGLITDNIILGTVGAFLGLGLSYIIKGIKGRNNLL